MRDSFIDNLLSELKQDQKKYLLTADLGFGIFEVFEFLRNKQYFNVGVCEQLMSSLAAGLSLEGAHVFTYSIGVFPTLRCLEQIRNDITYHDCKVTIVSSGAGYSYGSLGMSHHCVQDLGFVSSIPEISIYSPANKYEVDLFFKDLPPKPTYLRLDKEELNHEPLAANSINEPILYHKSTDPATTLVLAHGSIGGIAIPLLGNYSFDLYTCPLFEESQSLVNLLQKYRRVITIEEHSIKNGFFSLVSSIVSINHLPISIYPMALPHSHESTVGSQSYLRDISRLNTTSLREILEK